MAGHFVSIFLFPGVKRSFTFGATLFLFPLGTHFCYQLIGCWFDAGICFQPMNQKHVLVVESVKFEISFTANVVAPVGNAKMLIELILR